MSQMILKLEPVNLVQQIFNWIGTGTAILYFSSPLIQVIMLYKKKINIETIPLFLLITILFNCLFWIIYAIAGDDIIIPSLISNGIGLAINIVILFLYLYIFLEKTILPFIGYGLFVVNLLVEIFYLMKRYVVDKYHDKNKTLVGFVATIIGVIMYASPATNIYKLFKTGNYQMLPIFTNVIGFFNTLIWLLYGVITRDATTIVSNSVSFLVNTIQIGFWAYFFIKKVNENKKIVDEDFPENIENSNEISA